jgi:hypothetical protein
VYVEILTISPHGYRVTDANRVESKTNEAFALAAFFDLLRKVKLWIDDVGDRRLHRRRNNAYKM